MNCDGSANSIDALFVLQYHAGLIQSLPCEAAGDMNSDGRIDSVDAFLILQAASVLFQPIDISATASPYGWTDCVFQAAYSADPSLFTGSSLFTVIHSQTDWQRVWDYAIQRGKAHPATHCQEIGPTPILDVHFESEMAVALIELYPTSGYSLTLDWIESGSNRWILHATRTAPGAGCFVVGVFVYHYEFVKLARTDLPVELSVDEVTYDCNRLTPHRKPLR